MAQIVDIAKWDGDPHLFAYRFPESELNTKTQLIVSESQEAVFVKEGEFYGPFGPGRHVLNTKNYPFLTGFITHSLSGSTSPFTAEVWFIQKAIPLNLKWGTTIPIQLEDPQYHIMLPVRAFGQYGLQVENSKKFLSKMVGRIPFFTTDILCEYFRGIIITYVKDCLSSYLLEKNVSILHIGNKMREISENLNQWIATELLEFGVQTISFTVNAITTDERDPAVMQLKAALAKKAEMNIIGYTYQQERSFDTMEAAANNTGSGGSFIGAGIGLGLGAAAGIPMGNVMGNIAQNINTDKKQVCPNCSANIAAGIKFCPECGAALQKTPETQIKCSRCGAVCSSGKFCPGCGAKLQSLCCKCGAKILPGTKFCPECGAKQE